MLQNITEVSLAVLGADAAGPHEADGFHMLHVHLWCPSSIHSSKLGMEYLDLLFVSMKQTSHLVTCSYVTEPAEKREDGLKPCEETKLFCSCGENCRLGEHQQLDVL